MCGLSQPYRQKQSLKVSDTDMVQAHQVVAVLRLSRPPQLAGPIHKLNEQPRPVQQRNVASYRPADKRA